MNMIADALELNMGNDLVEPLRSFTDPDEDEDMLLSSVRTLTRHPSLTRPRVQAH